MARQRSRTIFSAMFTCLFPLFAGGLALGQSLEVVPVPFVPSNLAIPHDSYNGATTIFQAIARGGDGTYAYEWDFNGDGTYDSSDSTTNPNDLSATHTYPAQSFDRLFVAKVKVTSGSETATAEYRVVLREPATRSVKVNHAIDNALWYLHTQMIRFTTSSGVDCGRYDSQRLGATGMAVQAWEIQGHKANGNSATNPYVDDVRRGLNYCLLKTHAYEIAPQPAGDPDTNGNGIGLFSSYQSQIYETGIVLMALANSGDPTIVADEDFSDPYVAGRAYGEIAQDMVDFLAFAQNENGPWRGGWRYMPNNQDSDMSVTQWPVIGLEAAESNPDFAAVITVPEWVKTELRDNFLIYDQGADGGFGYTDPSWTNFPRTGAGLACQAWVGLQSSDGAVAAAVNYLDMTWDWMGGDGNLGNLYSMYAVNKGMRGFEPDIGMIGGHDWYAEYADWLIAQQDPDGGWTDCCWFENDLATAAGVLVLVKEVIQPPPVAVAKAVPSEAPPGAIISFDHSGSYHLDPGRTLTLFRWDFNDDGSWELETADVDARPTWVYDDDIDCGEEVIHLVPLEVEDDEGKTDMDQERVIIKINLFNHPPVADGDRIDSSPNYKVAQGGEVLLDASSSYDPDTGAPFRCGDPEAPDDHIVVWEWDLDNDGCYEEEGETLTFAIPAEWEEGSTHTAQLRVTDEGSWAGDDGGGSKSSETTVTISVIPNLPPDVSQAYPAVSVIKPPNHKMVDIPIYGITDPDGDPVIITVTQITQDEPINELDDGDTDMDADVVNGTARVCAERCGTGDGRVYEIWFVAEDTYGGASTGSVQVMVPLDIDTPCVNTGQFYTSYSP